MSTTFAVNVDSDEPVEVARRTSHEIIWVNRLAHLLPDDIEVIPLDNTAQGIHTIGDIKHDIKGRNKRNEPNDGYKDHRWNASSCGLEDTGTFADRPLTDETLKELGFVQKENRDWTNGKTVLGIWEGEVVVNIAISPTFTTVGKLKMLLEALKGE